MEFFFIFNTRPNSASPLFAFEPFLLLVSNNSTARPTLSTFYYKLLFILSNLRISSLHTKRRFAILIVYISSSHTTHFVHISVWMIGLSKRVWPAGYKDWALEDFLRLLKNDQVQVIVGPPAHGQKDSLATNLFRPDQIISFKNNYFFIFNYNTCFFYLSLENNIFSQC